MARRKLVRRTRTRVPDYTFLGCPLTKSRTAWCHGVCDPVHGVGPCGRLAPHALLGRTQMAILRHAGRRGGPVTDAD